MRALRLASLAVVVCLAGNGWCQLPDELPSQPSVEPEVSEPFPPREIDPSRTHLVFMPTYEVLPAGTATWGVADIMIPGISFSPVDFLQVGLSASILPVGLFTAGVKARLIRTHDGRAGIAAGIFHAGLDIFDNASTNDHTQLTSAYLTAGTHTGRFEFHSVLMRMRTRWNESVSFSPAPFGGNMGSRENVQYATLFGAGMKAHLDEQSSGLLECWAWNDGERMVLVALPAIQIAHDAACAEIGSPAIVVSDRVDVGFLPILVFTMSFN